VSVVVAVLAAAAILVGIGSASAPTSTARIPTLYVMYAMNCTFQFENDSGQVVSSIPPGNYEVDVRTPIAFGTVPLIGITDLTACHGQPMFQMTGPGVNIFTTMTSGCSVDLLFPETFQPNGSYVAQDNNQPSVTRQTLTVLGSGAPATPPPITISGATSSQSGDIVGSGIVGSGTSGTHLTLSAAVGSTGKPTLMLNGRPVTKLKSGRYTFSITDNDAKVGFTLLGPTWKTPSNLTGAKVGKSSRTLTLGAGRWTYYTNLQNVRYFVVTG
jgi:hypothetical protein